MMNNETESKLSICGLDCKRCTDYENGEIKRLSSKLAELLIGYERVANIKSEVNPFFKDYQVFLEFLQHFSKGACGGCRSENLQCPIECHAKICHKEPGVNYCFQCKEYPCEKQFESKASKERWIKRNGRMKEIGAENYYQEQSKLPRYK